MGFYRWRRARNETRNVIRSGGSGRQTVRVKASQNAQSNGGPDLEDSETKPLYSLFPLRTQRRTEQQTTIIAKFLTPFFQPKLH
ncbi:hypothetical protein Csa_010932 [Cucumis sativus]|uniref:Uncharacterized protein n=1 Tax=Cucumis sativus TaxID=3659 RepID=A0A0A0LBT3_CUCSA|nr:hypothetical protein Csa_010932 [Cucumis sativus]